MKRSVHAVPLLAAAATLLLAAQPAERPVSRVSGALRDFALDGDRAHSAAEMAAAGSAFLDALDAKLREEAEFAFDSMERRVWTNTPPQGPQGGVRLGDCDEEQIERAFNLLAACLSDQGFEKMRGILLADDELLDGGRPRPGFGAENFWLAIFGTPSAEAPWAWQLDGHHLALNLTMRGDDLCMSPSFVGTQPSRYTLGERTLEPLAQEAAQATALVQSLSEEQRAKAVISPRRCRNEAAAGKDGVIPPVRGVSCATFSDSQQEHLAGLLAAYVGNLPDPHATRRLEQLRGDLEALFFSWTGPTEPRSDMSYRLQGPDLILEFACQDLGGKPLDHLHTMYRDPTNEYGAGWATPR